MTLTPNLIACLAIGGAGILTALLSIPFFRHTGMLRRKCSARTTGTVVRYRLQRRGSGCGTSIAPVVEFQAAGEIYTAYRHYKGIAVSKKVVPISDGTAGKTRIAVRNDVFHIQQTGTVHSLEAAAGELWRLGSTLPVVYDPKKSQACLRRTRGFHHRRGRRCTALCRCGTAGAGSFGRSFILRQWHRPERTGFL